MSYLPSKKFILTVVILAIIFTAGFGYYKYKNSPAKKDLAYEKKSAAEPKKLNEFLDKDSDNDGLKDWEETLWKTDINNFDTDKDGTSDGEEVKINRDPTKAGQNDKIEAEKDENATSTDTLTQKLGKEFLMDYLTLKTTEPLNENQKEEIVSSMLQKLTNENEIPVYELKDIKTSNDNSKEAVKKYADSLGKAFQNFNLIQNPEMAILTDILFNEEEEFPEKIEELKTNRLLYEKTAKDILEITAPSKHGNTSLDIANALNNTAKIISKMELIYSDPAQTIVALQEYFNESENTVRILKTFKASLKKDKVFLLPDEPGYIFLTNDFF